MAILDHIEFAVSDAAISCKFYEAALQPLGIGLVISVDASRTGKGARHGLGANGYPTLWIHDGAQPSRGLHVAFSVATRALVDAFWNAALASGGVDNGAPGIRARYHDHYYAAYVLDPDGVNVEVVCQAQP